MSCPSDESRLSAWMDGELDDAEANQVQAHVSLCARCRELADSFAELRVEGLEPDPSFVVRFREARDQESLVFGWSWEKLTMRLVPVALAVLAAAGLAVWAQSPPAQELPPLQAFELEALGDPVALDTAPESLISLSQAAFPDEIP